MSQAVEMLMQAEIDRLRLKVDNLHAQIQVSDKALEQIGLSIREDEQEMRDVALSAMKELHRMQTE